ncbi:hypothetical protein [Microbacterium sp. NIBRBAC000506063]|uniref:hypothetical protein n=1 Tax=Microbacterium sp. NIBRBAC000506063 TaxID=2734618 RepID=UPI001BB4CA27|nr:hypothetical protein [Microbacterium sp. NIBRBAC000506063]QTV80745.1 hypothetical protein KAE78_04795 [Microbacterium sp. NIBRBAC000506063]
MKTTIEIPDALAAEAKRAALAERTTLRELMVTALRAELDRRGSIGPVDFHFPTVGGAVSSSRSIRRMPSHVPTVCLPRDRPRHQHPRLRPSRRQPSS